MMQSYYKYFCESKARPTSDGLDLDLFAPQVFRQLFNVQPRKRLSRRKAKKLRSIAKTALIFQAQEHVPRNDFLLRLDCWKAHGQRMSHSLLCTLPICAAIIRDDYKTLRYEKGHRDCTHLDSSFFGLDVPESAGISESKVCPARSTRPIFTEDGEWTVWPYYSPSKQLLCLRYWCWKEEQGYTCWRLCNPTTAILDVACHWTVFPDMKVGDGDEGVFWTSHRRVMTPPTLSEIHTTLPRSYTLWTSSDHQGLLSRKHSHICTNCQRTFKHAHKLDGRIDNVVLSHGLVCPDCSECGDTVAKAKIWSHYHLEIINLITSGAQPSLIFASLDYAYRLGLCSLRNPTGTCEPVYVEADSSDSDDEIDGIVPCSGLFSRAVVGDENMQRVMECVDNVNRMAINLDRHLETCAEGATGVMADSRQTLKIVEGVGYVAAGTLGIVALAKILEWFAQLCSPKQRPEEIRACAATEDWRDMLDDVPEGKESIAAKLCSLATSVVESIADYLKIGISPSSWKAFLGVSLPALAFAVFRVERGYEAYKKLADSFKGWLEKLLSWAFNEKIYIDENRKNNSIDLALAITAMQTLRYYSGSDAITQLDSDRLARTSFVSSYVHLEHCQRLYYGSQQWSRIYPEINTTLRNSAATYSMLNQNEDPDGKYHPFCIYSYGDPNSGKTEFFKAFSEFVKRKLKAEGHGEFNRIYYQRHAADQFYSRYNDEFIMLLDDFAQMRSPNYDHQYADFFQLIGPAHHSLNMAGVEQKGRSFNSRIIFCTSNDGWPTPTCVKSHAALHRRRHVMLKFAKNTKATAVGSSTDDYSEVTVLDGANRDSTSPDRLWQGDYYYTSRNALFEDLWTRFMAHHEEHNSRFNLTFQPPQNALYRNSGLLVPGHVLAVVYGDEVDDTRWYSYNAQGEQEGIIPLAWDQDSLTLTEFLSRKRGAATVYLRDKYEKLSERFEHLFPASAPGDGPSPWLPYIKAVGVTAAVAATIAAIWKVYDYIAPKETDPVFSCSGKNRSARSTGNYTQPKNITQLHGEVRPCAGEITENDQQFIAAVMKNVVHIQAELTKKTVCYGFFTHGHRMLMPVHAAKFLRKDEQFILTRRGGAGSTEYRVKLSNYPSFEIANTDYLVIDLTGSPVTAFPDIRSHFLSKTKHFAAIEHEGLYICDSVACHTTHSLMSTTLTPGVVTLHADYLEARKGWIPPTTVWSSKSAFAMVGACGLPLFVRTSTGELAIGGLLDAAGPRETLYSYLSHEMVEGFSCFHDVQDDPSSGMTIEPSSGNFHPDEAVEKTGVPVLGPTSPRAYTPRKSNLIPGFLHGIISEPTKEPAILSVHDPRSQGKDPMEYSLRKQIGELNDFTSDQRQDFCEPRTLLANTLPSVPNLALPGSTASASLFEAPPAKKTAPSSSTPPPATRSPTKAEVCGASTPSSALTRTAAQLDLPIVRQVALLGSSMITLCCALGLVSDPASSTRRSSRTSRARSPRSPKSPREPSPHAHWPRPSSLASTSKASSATSCTTAWTTVSRLVLQIAILAGIVLGGVFAAIAISSAVTFPAGTALCIRSSSSASPTSPTSSTSADSTLPKPNVPDTPSSTTSPTTGPSSTTASSGPAAGTPPAAKSPPTSTPSSTCSSSTAPGSTSRPETSQAGATSGNTLSSRSTETTTYSASATKLPSSSTCSVSPATTRPSTSPTPTSVQGSSRANASSSPSRKCSTSTEVSRSWTTTCSAHCPGHPSWRSCSGATEPTETPLTETSSKPALRKRGSTVARNTTTFESRFNNTPLEPQSRVFC